MITNYEQLVKHNRAFYNAFIDLKVVGWKSYSKSVNDYTFNFFKTQMTTLDSAVDKLGDIMKGEFDGK